MDPILVPELFGELDVHLKKIEKELRVILSVNDDMISIKGSHFDVKLAEIVIPDLILAVKKGNGLSSTHVNFVINRVLDTKHARLDTITSEHICVTPKGKYIRPKTAGQKLYVDMIRKKTIVFGVGPAGTGKTYLAMAHAITAFKKNEVNRIILTRPAIEAGEKLGFLPGDLQSKVDPYLRPLYDALYEIMGAESYIANMEG